MAGREGILEAYVERPAKHYNAAYGTFYNAITIDKHRVNRESPLRFDPSLTIVSLEIH
ncbi:MAG: hypothetical protein KKD44_13355 [Proteobacteria bacterium]|nr:hypothetical protein [Pseudomonadota bacterium]